MQKKDGNKNLLRSNTWNQGQQIQPRRDVEDRCTGAQVENNNAIENGGHLSLLPNHSALFNSIVTPKPRRKRINAQLMALNFCIPQLSTFLMTPAGDLSK